MPSGVLSRRTAATMTSCSPKRNLSIITPSPPLPSAHPSVATQLPSFRSSTHHSARTSFPSSPGNLLSPRREPPPSRKSHNTLSLLKTPTRRYPAQSYTVSTTAYRRQRRNSRPKTSPPLPNLIRTFCMVGSGMA